MDFKDQIQELSGRIEKLKDQIQTEEATKNSLVLPFISTLGYDIFNPLEVVPEFTCDIGIKKGEKIDYAILKDNKPIILIECKHWASDLNLHSGQLLRYFQVSNAKFGILTNGIIYRFYSDLQKPNKMDEQPFFEINLTNFKEEEIEELKKFHKSYFNLENILSTASELKYISELKNLIRNELANPSDQMVRFLTKQVYSGTLTSKVLEQFTAFVRKSMNAVLDDLITERIKIAIQKGPETSENIDKKNKNINTTLDEIESYFIVKAILSKKVNLDRIKYRDTASHFSIILDDNIRKPICKLILDEKKKVLITYDENKNSINNYINSLDEIYNYSQQFFDIVDKYERGEK